MRFSPLAVSAFLLLAGAVASAQEPASEPPPEPPLIATPAANSQWTITYKHKAVGKSGTKAEDVRARKLRLRYNPLVQSRRVLKGAEQTVVYTTYEAGLKSEAWVVGGYLYQLPMREGEGVNVEPRTQGDFSELYWVTAANFRGTVPYKGRKVHLYESDATDPAKGPPPTPDPRHPEVRANPPKPVVQRAYIDSETRLPVVVDAGTTVWTYQFTEGPITLPAMDERIRKIVRDVTAPRKP